MKKRVLQNVCHIRTTTNDGRTPRLEPSKQTAKCNTTRCEWQETKLKKPENGTQCSEQERESERESLATSKWSHLELCKRCNVTAMATTMELIKKTFWLVLFLLLPLLVLSTVVVCVPERCCDIPSFTLISGIVFLFLLGRLMLLCLFLRG